MSSPLSSLRTPWRVVRHAKLLPLLLLASLAACRPQVNPQAPVPVPAPDLRPEVSVVQVPLAVAYSDIAGAVNAALPVSHDVPRYNEQINGGADNCPRGMSIGYYVRRGPIQVAPEAVALRIRTALEYGGAARFRPRVIVCLLPIADDCGYDGNGPRRARARLALRPGVRQDWGLDANIHDAGVEPDNECKVGPFALFNVTGRIMEVVNRQIASKTPEINKRLAEAPWVRERVERVWTLAHRPLPIDTIGTINIQPVSLGVGALAYEPESLRVSLRVAATPFVALGRSVSTEEAVAAAAGDSARVTSVTNTGATPVDSDSVPPLPPNSGAGGDDSVRIYLPVRATYASVDGGLRKALKLDEGGVRFPESGRKHIRVTSVAVGGHGNELIVALGFRGSAKGTIYLQGTPVYDAATQRVTVPNLDYTLETKNVLLKVIGWFQGDALRQTLRDNATLALGPLFTRAQAAMQAVVNGRHGPLEFRGTVGSVDLAAFGIDPKAGELAAIARVHGRVSATVVPGAP